MNDFRRSNAQLSGEGGMYLTSSSINNKFLHGRSLSTLRFEYCTCSGGGGTRIGSAGVEVPEEAGVGGCDTMVIFCFAFPCLLTLRERTLCCPSRVGGLLWGKEGKAPAARLVSSISLILSFSSCSRVDFS
jgi:hypothetical protein